jgi:hypothetical protein
VELAAWALAGKTESSAVNLLRPTASILAAQVATTCQVAILLGDASLLALVASQGAD